MAKVFFDTVNNKEVYDTLGTKTKAEVIAEFGLDASTQEVTLGPDEAQEVVGGVLKKFDRNVRVAAATAARQAAQLTKKNALKTKLGLTDAEMDDLISLAG